MQLIHHPRIRSWIVAGTLAGSVVMAFAVGLVLAAALGAFLMIDGNLVPNTIPKEIGEKRRSSSTAGLEQPQP